MCASIMSAAPQKPAGRYDGQILQDVNKYIQGKKEFQGVKASVEDQIVTLDGAVNLYIDRENLEKKVKKIKNVDGIRNHVQVQSNVPDEQLRQSLADRLRYDRVGYGIAFNVLTLGRERRRRDAGRHGARLSQQRFRHRGCRDYARCQRHCRQYRGRAHVDV